MGKDTGTPDYVYDDADGVPQTSGPETDPVGTVDRAEAGLDPVGGDVDED